QGQEGVAGGPRPPAPSYPREGCVMEESLDAAYRYCQALTRREARNFYYGFLLLPWPQRQAIYAAYAFARKGDDIVDEELPPQEKALRLAAFRESLDRCLAGAPQGPLFTALHHAVNTFNIPHQYLYELIEGVEMDLSVRRYASFSELSRYCYLVAASVGLISIEIFGYKRGPLAREHAIDLGLAFQLTNILRDLREDAGRDRIYIPLDELARFGYGEAELLAGVANDPFRRLLAYQIGRARDYYRQGRRLLPYLPKRARACVGVMSGIYGRILDSIEGRPTAVFRERIGLGTGQKLALAGRELVRSWGL
ncbi:MAG: presqualene diphosphate synthase HpnD, partial [Dehalococcoidia bacterium]